MAQKYNVHSQDVLPNLSMEEESIILTKNTSIECNENNGLVLNEFYVPTEVLLSILCSVDATTLRKSCVLVCKKWRDLITECVWKLKAEIRIKKKLPLINSRAYFFICMNNNFDKNLITNPSGGNKLAGWVIFNNGGEGWTVEDTPQGCEPLPEGEFGENTKCFATSYGECTKCVEIDLLKHNFTPDLLELQPDIYICEWYGVRFDCGCEYNLNVTVSDDKKVVLKEFDFRFTEEQFQGGTWNKIEHTFKNYGKFGRYITFYHSGKDNLFWAGHYGIKLAGATVKILSNTLGQNHNEDNESKCCLLEKKGNGPIQIRTRNSYELLYPNWFLQFGHNPDLESDESDS